MTCGRMCAVVGSVARDDTRHRTSKTPGTSHILVVAEVVRPTIEGVEVEVRHPILRLDIVARAGAPSIERLLLDGLGKAWTWVGDLNEVHRLLETKGQTCAQEVADT